MIFRSYPLHLQYTSSENTIYGTISPFYKMFYRVSCVSMVHRKWKYKQNQNNVSQALRHQVHGYGYNHFSNMSFAQALEIESLAMRNE